MSTINIRNIIDVQTITQQTPPSRRDFRNVLFVFDGVEVGGSRVQSYTSLNDVVDAYGSNSEPAKAAASFYSGGFNGIKPLTFWVANYDKTIGAEVWADVITEILSDARYYMLTLDQTLSETEVTDFATAVEASQTSYIFLRQSDDTEIKDTDATTDTGSIAKVWYDAKYTRSMAVYHTTLDEYADVKFCSYFATVDFTAARPLGKLAFKQFTGLTGVTITNTEYTNLLSKNANFYTAFGEAGRTIAYDGAMASGDQMDSIIAVHYLNYNMTYDIFDLMVSLPKLAYTLEDFARLEQAMSKSFIELRNGGVIAGGTDPDTGEEIPQGYKISIPAISDIPTEDKAAGILQGIVNTGLLSGGAIKFTITNVLKFSA